MRQNQSVKKRNSHFTWRDNHLDAQNPFFRAFYVMNKLNFQFTVCQTIWRKTYLSFFPEALVIKLHLISACCKSLTTHLICKCYLFVRVPSFFFFNQLHSNLKFIYKTTVSLFQPSRFSTFSSTWIQYLLFSSFNQHRNLIAISNLNSRCTCTKLELSF